MLEFLLKSLEDLKGKIVVDTFTEEDDYMNMIAVKDVSGNTSLLIIESEYYTMKPFYFEIEEDNEKQVLNIITGTTGLKEFMIRNNVVTGQQFRELENRLDTLKIEEKNRIYNHQKETAIEKIKELVKEHGREILQAVEN